MKLDRAAILALDSESFSAAEKQSLIERFFPDHSSAPWQDQLKLQWQDAKRWGQYLGSPARPLARPYRVTHANLLAAARAVPPKTAGCRVTDFSGWIFSLYRKTKDPLSLANGQRVERAVARLARAPINEGWDLIYQDSLSDRSDVKSISRLTVDGKALRGIPDLVFRERATGRLIIVERKASNRDIPSDGWPNLRAQLWAYSKIDDWADAPETLLVGEIWGFTGRDVYFRGVRIWNRDDPEFERANFQLFYLYRQGCP